MDPVVDDEVEVAQLLESVKQLPPPPPVETPKDTGQTVANQAAAAAAEAAKHASAGGQGGGVTGRARSISDARAAIANEMNQLNVAMVGALNATGGATNRRVLLRRHANRTAGWGRRVRCRHRLWGCSRAQP